MTREERKLTIEYLEGIMDNYVEGYGYERHPLPEYYAIESAINALEQEPCGDLISRQATLEPYKILNDTDTLCVALIRANIMQQPSVKPQEPKTGKWLYKEITDDYRVTGQCSECKERRIIDNFCSNCGARMVEPQESEE